jgi:hypothetical protein
MQKKLQFKQGNIETGQKFKEIDEIAYINCLRFYN